MSKFEERLEHTEKLVKGLSEQTSGNITIINSNCQMLANRLEALEKRVEDIEMYTSVLVERVQDLETKTASDLSQTVVAESATSEEQDCLWIARDKRTDTLYVYEVEPVEQYCETFAADDEEEKSFRIDFDLFTQVTFENSPQKLVLESSISKTETVPKENSEKQNNQEFDKERALELLQDIESSSTKNSNASTKAILLSCAELREMLVGE